MLRTLNVIISMQRDIRFFESKRKYLSVLPLTMRIYIYIYIHQIKHKKMGIVTV